MALLLQARLVFAGQLSYSQASVRGSGSSSEEPIFPHTVSGLFQVHGILIFISQPCAELCTRPSEDGKGRKRTNLPFPDSFSAGEEITAS